MGKILATATFPSFSFVWSHFPSGLAANILHALALQTHDFDTKFFFSLFCQPKSMSILS
jgi:hypothetical protein